MHLHEYQAKEFLNRYGVKSPPFTVISSLEEAKKAIDFDEAVVKIQVHAGGRGKAGGVKRVKGKEKILETVKALLGFKMVNNQTGPAGVIAEKVIVGKPIDIEKEYYIAVTIDRKEKSVVLIASKEGGVDIEEIAEKHPESIIKMHIFPDGKFRDFQHLRLCKVMGWEGEVALEGKVLVQGLIKAFLEMDGSLLEINPLVKTPQGQLLALDAKITIDDNALFRQVELASLEDLSQLPEVEKLAKEQDLSYIALDGNIGCMVNGAGLAMATMDLIKLFGGNPANFLDVGGGASLEKVSEGFSILLNDPHVKAVLVNIFGGIMNCDIIAAGLIDAVSKQKKVEKPLVVRLEGTNVESARKMLKDSGLKLVLAKDLSDGAKKVVELCRS